MYKKLLPLILFLQSCCAWAISNIENERINLPEEGLSGGIKIEVDGKTGNQKKESYEASIKSFYRADNEIFMVLFAREYGSTQDIKDTDAKFVHARWTHLLNDKWAVESFVQHEQNEFDNLTSRILAGGGGRYTIAQEKDSYSFIVGLGGFREYEKLNLITYEENNQIWRVNSYYSFQYKINDQVMVANSTYYQPATADTGDYRMLSDIDFLIKLSNSLHFNVSYRITYDSQPAKNLDANPPIDNHRANSEYKTGLTYSF